MEEDKYFQVQTTASSREEAGKIADALLSSKASACVKILPGGESYYHWQGKIEKASELLLLINTTASRYAEVEQIIKSIHSYENPEIIALKIKKGSPEYLGWIKNETGFASRKGI